LKASRLRYFMAADESGGEGDSLRVLALLSGPGQGLLQLERELRLALARHRQREIKWSRLRTRRERLNAAQDFLALARASLASGQLRVDLALYEEGQVSKAWRQMDEPSRLLELYAGLTRRARKAWGRGRYGLYPDQRTGMAWQRLQRASLWSLREQASHRVGLVQLADLIAGLTRFASQPRAGAAPLAAARRAELLEIWDQRPKASAKLWRVKRLDRFDRRKKTRSKK